jgi:penicillin-binding protein 1C
MRTQASQAGAPAPPPGVVMLATRFAPAVEPPRREWYLRGAVLSSRESAAVPQTLLPRIESPANGMVIAVDPDIPLGHQRVLIAVQGARKDMQLDLNGRILGPARPGILWAPRPGAYRLTLEDPAGRSLDRILFTVRGPPG